jgi:cytidine deaminase
MIDWDKLITEAKRSRSNAYARFSNFKVGAALLGADGRIITGCNVENSSYGLTMCAERTALFKAVSEGIREYLAIAVYSETSPPTRPCGACRQVLYEFNPLMEIACANADGKIDKFTLSELLPEGFKL